MGGSGKMGGDKKVGKKAAAYSPASSRLPTPASFISIDIPAGVIGKKASEKTHLPSLLSIYISTLSSFHMMYS